MTWLLNMDGYTSRNSPPFSVSLETMNILQSHYPERLGLAIVTQAPTVFKMLWTAIGPFLDPVTKEKVRFEAWFLALVLIFRPGLVAEFGPDFGREIGPKIELEIGPEIGSGCGPEFWP